MTFFGDLANFNRPTSMQAMLDLPKVTDGTAETSIANWMLYVSAL